MLPMLPKSIGSFLAIFVAAPHSGTAGVLHKVGWVPRQLAHNARHGAIGREPTEVTLKPRIPLPSQPRRGAAVSF